MVLEDGTVLEGKLHPSFTEDDIVKLVARLIDLARAYKQLSRKPCDADFAISSIQGEGGRWLQ